MRPVGASEEVPVDVRILAATNRDVEADVEAGRFRQDLYYRLNVIRLALPPLRERREDVPLLADRFRQRFAHEMGKDIVGFTPDALRAIERYDFPGNVRELENVIERAVALAGSRVIGLGDLPQAVSGHLGAPEPGLLTLPPEGCELDAVLHEVERRLVISALERTRRRPQGCGESARRDLSLVALSPRETRPRHRCERRRRRGGFRKELRRAKGTQRRNAYLAVHRWKGESFVWGRSL